MKKAAIVMMVAFLAVMVLAPAAMAQDNAAARAAARRWARWRWRSAWARRRLAAAWARVRIASAACEGMARNPGAAGPIRAAMILGLVFVETLVLFTLAMLALKA